MGWGGGGGGGSGGYELPYYHTAIMLVVHDLSACLSSYIRQSTHHNVGYGLGTRL